MFKRIQGGGVVLKSPNLSVRTSWMVPRLKKPSWIRFFIWDSQG